MTEHMDTSPDSEADTASGGAPEPADDNDDDSRLTPPPESSDGVGASSDTPTEDPDGTPVENPSGG